MNAPEAARAGTLSRKRFLGLAGMSAGALALGSCGLLPGRGRELSGLPRARGTGRVREYALRAAPVEFEAGDRVISTWGYEGGVPGPEIRVQEGDTLLVRVRNDLPENTTVHWHGLPVESAMDGVPGLSQRPIGPGEEFVYEFVVPGAGTYMYHSHVGLQLDRGLYGPLVVEPKKEDLGFDREYILAFDDWLDGVSGTPEDAFAQLQSSGGRMMGGMDSGDLSYPLYLVNGRPPEDPETLEVSEGEWVRYELLNRSMMAHPMHLHGHFFQIQNGTGRGPIKDTALVEPHMGRLAFAFVADNPGDWFFHCHNA